MAKGPSVFDLPIPAELKQQWKTLETRRHFLGRGGKTLGWAGARVALGRIALSATARPADARSRNAREHAFSPHGEAGHLPLHVRRAAAHGPLGLQARASANGSTKTCPNRSAANRQPTGMTAGQSRFPVAPPHWGFTQHGRCGRLVFRAAALHGQARRRRGRHQLDVHRRHQPRAGDPVDEHRQHDARQAVDGRMAGLRAWAA